MSRTQPTLFISHGGPNIILDDTPARDNLRKLTTQLPEKPKAILIVSAHFEKQGAVVVSDPQPETLYDFGGFQPELYQMVYPSPGDPDLALRVQQMLKEAGIEATLLAKRGFDHGTWTSMKLAFPDADIPIVQLSIDPTRDALYHFHLGAALSSLREEGVLLIGSGHITHNLRAVFGAMRNGIALDDELAKKVSVFTEWFAEKFAAGDQRSILNWSEEAPFVAENHPTDEHLMPIFFAYGAAGVGAKAERFHASKQFGFFAFDCYRFSD